MNLSLIFTSIFLLQIMTKQIVNNTHSFDTPQSWDRLFPFSARLLVWGLLFSILYMFRSFFPLIFLTFVFSYIQTNGVNRFAPYIKNRTLRVILVGIVFLSAIVTLSLFLAPRVATQTKGFVSQFTNYVYVIDVELLKLTAKYPSVAELVPKAKIFQASDNTNNHDPKKWRLEYSPSMSLISQFFGLGEEVSGQKFLKLLLDNLANVGTTVASLMVSIIATFLLALLFSFLIVLDLPKLTASIAELEHTKLQFFYVEVADSIRDFCRVLGEAFEAQFIIAIVNTVLTAIGVIYLLNLGEHVAFLSVIVFLTSFIPVAGVFISSIPLCLIALQLSGFNLMLMAILMITAIHMIEAYVLNPEIYGHRLRINPVIVLIILTIGGTLFSFWGLILGVPLFTYLFGYAIRYHHSK